MAATTAQPERSRWSISRLAVEFGMDRRTISALVEGVQPAGTERGNAVYSLRDVAVPISKWLQGQPGQVTLASGEEVDPKSLPPRERDWFYSSEKSRIAAEREARLLCQSFAVEQELRKLAAPVAQMLETLPDLLERDAGLAPEQIALVREIVDAERNRCAEAAEG